MKRLAKRSVTSATLNLKNRENDIFKGLNIFLVPKGIGSIQLRIIQEQIQKRGGKLAAKVDHNVDVIISPVDPFKTIETIGTVRHRARIHKLAWITESLSRGKRAGDDEFLLESFSNNAPIIFKPLQRAQSDLSATTFLKRKIETSGHIFTPPAKRAKTDAFKLDIDVGKGSLSLFYEIDIEDTEELSKEQISGQIEFTAKANSPLQSAFQPLQRLDKKDSSQSSSEYECEVHLKKSQELSPQGKKKQDINPFLALLRQSSQPINTSHIDYDDITTNQTQEPDLKLFDFNTPETSPMGKFSPPNSNNAKYSNRSLLLKSSTSPDSPTKKAMRSIKGNSFQKLFFDEDRDSGEEYDTDEEEMILDLKEEKKRGKLAKKGSSGRIDPTSDNNTRLSEMEEYTPIDSQAVDFDENSSGGNNAPLYSRYLYNITPEEKQKRDKRRQYFVCQKSPQQLQTEKNVNKVLTDQLQILEQNCQTKGDKWRSYAYRKAIAVLKATKFEIKTADQAKKLRGIGSKIADKIGEILSTGSLRRIKSEAEDELTKTLVMFSKVFGAGPETAKKWYAKGYRTIEDLKNSDKLTQQQKVGVKYYEEFQKRIPREEVDVLSGIVYKHALEIDPEFIMEVCGSYRRGKKDCGDIDVLLTHKTNRPIDGAIGKLIDGLTEIGFLTDHLTDPHKSKENDKYMGVCQWGESPHRRIDIKIVPKEEWWLALLYFTGSDHFNRSMRLWARRHGYQLSEKHVVKRYAEDVLSEPIPVNSEQDVFAVLGLEYRPPNEREV